MSLATVVSLVTALGALAAGLTALVKQIGHEMGHNEPGDPPAKDGP